MLKVKETPGQGGVTRLRYYFDQINIGSARIMGTTLGDISVHKRFRRKGYGMQILKDLERRGVLHACAGSDEGAALLQKAGWVPEGYGRWTRPTP